MYKRHKECIVTCNPPPHHYFLGGGVLKVMGVKDANEEDNLNGLLGVAFRSGSVVVLCRS